MSHRNIPFWNHLFQLWEQFLSFQDMPQLDRWLSAEMRKRKQFGKSDRFWYSELIFSAVRFGYLVSFLEYGLSKGIQREFRFLPEHLFASFLEKYPDSDSVIRSWGNISPEQFFKWIVLRYQAAHPGSSVRAVSGTDPREKNYSELFHQIARELISSNNVSAQLIWSGIPLWFKELLHDRRSASGWSLKTFRKFIDSQDFRPPLWLRINQPDKTESVLSELKEQHFETALKGYAVKALGSKGIFELNAYKNGWFEIQDHASQEIGASVNPKPGQLVWDCCAGGGGKTIQIAARPGGNRGAVYASDIRGYKLDELRRRSRRTGLHNIRTVVWDGNELPGFGREVQLKRGFHWVLVDAPCSASGTWRRNPDARWRFRLSDLSDLTSLQLQLLNRASEAVRPEGHLVYATCSWLVQENENIVKLFLKERAEFLLVSQRMVGSPDEDSDTMFVAVMKKK